MHFGVQLEAPVGFGALIPGERYYFAGDAESGRVHLAWFHKDQAGWRVRLISVERPSFEAALASNPPRLRPHDVQLVRPVWLADVARANFDAREATRPGAPKQTYRQQCESRLLVLAPALRRKEEILGCADPIKLLNEVARAAGPSVHPHRFAVWFYAYVLHSEDLWALKRPTHRSGAWPRTSEQNAGKKFGRRAADDKTPFNSPGTGARAAMVKSYQKRQGPGVAMKTMWWESMIEDFGCIAVQEGDGNWTLTHPQNGPIWSYGQFRYAVVCAMGLAAVQTNKYGAARQRAERPYNEGNQSAQYSSILEGFEADAYFVSDRPRAMFSDGPAAPLVGARGVCCKTSEVVGVGFSIGAENDEAYRAMLFFCVAPRFYLEKMYGLPAGHLANWHVLGLPPNFRSDRGVAGRKRFAANVAASMPMKSVVPTGEGQSKPFVESGHPRDTRLEGPPSYVQSDLNTPQLIKREIYEAHKANHGSDISPRLTDAEIDHFEKKRWAATPHNYCTLLLERLATKGRSMSLVTAVREFWTPIKVKTDRDGVLFRGRHWNSPEFKESGIQSKLASVPSIELDGYCLSAVLLSLWVEVGGNLIEVEPAMKARVDKEDLLVNVSELVSTAEKLKKIRSITRRSAAAAEVDAGAKFKEATGKEWRAGRRRAGTPKKPTGTAAHEAEIMKRGTRAKKAA